MDTVVGQKSVPFLLVYSFITLKDKGRGGGGGGEKTPLFPPPPPPPSPHKLSPAYDTLSITCLVTSALNSVRVLCKIHLRLVVPRMT